MRKHLLLVFFLFLSLFITAQENLIISGIVEADASEDSQIHIINITQKTGTLTSEDGTFQIRIKVNDTLVFSSLVYVPKKVIISFEVIEEGFLLVSLEKEVNELEEVKISDLNLSGNINADLNTLEVVDKFDLGVPISKKTSSYTGTAKG